MSVSQEQPPEPDIAATRDRVPVDISFRPWTEVGARRRLPKRCWDFIRRKSLLLLALGALGAGCGVLTVEQIAPAYVAVSHLVIADDASMRASAHERASSPLLVRDILGTLPLAEQRLYDPRYAEPRVTPLERLRIWLGLPRPDAVWPLSRWLAKGDENATPAEAFDNLSAAFSGALTVSVRPGGLVVGFRAADAAVARRGANLVANGFVASEHAASLEAAERTGRWLAERAAELNRHLAASPDGEPDVVSQQIVDNLARVSASLARESEPQVRVSAPATTPETPAHPRRTAIIAISVAGGVLFGLLLALVGEVAGRGLRGLERIEARTGLPVLGALPRTRRRTAPADMVLSRPRAPYSDAVRELRAHLLLPSDQGHSRTVTIVSAVAGDGRSSTALSLSRVSAASGFRTLILDADTTAPALHRALNIPNERGLTDYLSGKCGLDEVIEIDFESHAHCILAGPSSPNAADLLSSDRMSALLATLRTAYDLIIIDTPPIRSCADGLTIAQQSDVTLFLISWGHTRRRAVRAALVRLKAIGVKPAGIVLTNVNLRRFRRYHGGQAMAGPAARAPQSPAPG
jgi:capsular exopolysaccharide synthesis family protein